MTTVTVFKSKTDIYRGFSCIGHAGYAESGSDVVCAAVSVLVINTINAIEAFGNGQKFTCHSNEETGEIHFSLLTDPNVETNLLLNTMLLGLKDVQKQHKNYLRLKFKEV